MGKIQFKNVNKIYPNGFHAIHDFNLTIDEGEFIVFVGPSGLGKSTFSECWAVWSKSVREK